MDERIEELRESFAECDKNQDAFEAESAADDMRREIELTLYGKALLPDSRGDVLGLLESFDRLPNMAETGLFALRCQRIQLPGDLVPLYKQLVDINLQSYYLCRRAVDALFGDNAVDQLSRGYVENRVMSTDTGRQLPGLGDQLHIAVLDAVVHHFDIVARTVVANPFTTGRAILYSGSDGLKDGLDVGPGVGRAAGHDRWPAQRAFFAAGDAAADEQKPFLFQLL